MKMRFPVLFLTCGALLSGCVAIPPERPAADPAVAESEFKMARESGEELLEKFRQGDYKGFAALLPEDTRKKITEADFNAIRKNMTDWVGEIEEIEFLTPLKSELLQNLVWKVRFNRKSQQGELLEEELLFQTMVGIVDGKPQIMGFGFLFLR